VTYLALALGTAVAVTLGVLGVVYGEADDSPGLQGLGALLVVGAIAFAVRTVRRGRRPQGGHR
jgi:hypothetical protein